MDPLDVRIDYTNWRGERAWRTIRPIETKALFHGASEWHKEPQWLLRAFDYERESFREFAMKDIHAWEPAPPSREDK